MRAEARWIILPGGVTVGVQGSPPLVPLASEIFAAEFRGRDEIRGSEALGRPSSTLTQVSFSQAPLDLQVVLAPQGQSRAPTVRVLGSRWSREWDVTSAATLGADHAICDGAWHPFRQGVLDEIAALLAAFGVAPGDRLTLQSYLDLVRESRTNPLISDRVGSGAEFWSEYGLQEVSVPSSFEGMMYPYQLAGYRWLSFISDEGLGGILADEMGLGKTIQVIALITRVVDEGLRPCLVVCPATLTENWRRELMKFAPDLRVLIHRGARRTGFPSVLAANDVIVTSYETATHDVSMLQRIRWHVVALDEAQAIKNPTAHRTRALKSLPRHCALAVTGTPVQNRLIDAWSLCDFVMPGFLGAQREFEESFDDTTDAAADLEPVLSPLLLRRRVRDVAQDLPALIDTPEAVELDDAAAVRYEQLLSEARCRFDGSYNLGVLSTLRMFCAHPFLVDGPGGDPAEASTKYRRMLEILQEIAGCGEKCLVFCGFRAMLDLAVSDLNRRGLPSYWIDGRIPVPQRQEIIDGFSTTEGPSVLVLNPRAAGTGLNIVAANHAIHYTLEWNPAVIDQASARVYRRGQERPVTIHRLFHASTIEDVMNDRLQHKRDLADKAVVGVLGHQENLQDLLRVLNTSPLRMAP